MQQISDEEIQAIIKRPDLPAAEALAQYRRLMNDQQPQVPAGEHHPNMGGPVVPQCLPNPSRYLVTPNRPVIAAGANNSQRIDFGGAGPGWIIAHRGTVVRADNVGTAPTAGANIAAITGVQMFFNSGENIITNGDAAAFTPFDALYPEAAPMQPMMRYVTQRDILTVTFQNLIPTAAGSAITITPVVTFGFLSRRYPDAVINGLRRLGIAAGLG